ncbi:long-chain fatty acid--CoA ligase [Glycocaulis abyssi]|uniref:Long-chain fatty acid--CoA ligase n=1 Tax=Glycocaulis abyssi TaxID=1433403 RepID=A0ABV9NEE5_9PROT
MVAATAADLPRLAGGKRFASSPARVLENAETKAGKAAYVYHHGSDWVPRTWQEYAGEVKQAGRALLALGFQKDQSVAILGFNRPEWTIIAHAAMMAGGRPAGIYWTSAPPEIAYILQHSESPVYLVEDAEQARQALELKADCPNLVHIIVMRGAEAPEGTMSWEAFMALGAEDHEDALLARLDALEEHGIATLIYTSGTTGPPKAVMLSHGNVAWSASVLIEMFGRSGDDRSLSYLPIAHIAEQQASVHNHAAAGGTLWFARSMETLADDLKACRPTIFFGVPRVWEKMAETIQGRLAEATGPKAKLAKWAMDTAREVNLAQIDNRSVSPLLKAQKAIADKLVLSKVKDALGLDKSRMLISGAAPISTEVLRFFAGLDLVIYEGYGQSETSAPSSFNGPGAARLGSVGKLVPGMEARVTEEGELLVKGPNIFKGYMKNNDATSDSFTADGWMRTGDVVNIDDDGFIFITGRIKDIIITAGGKNITPANLETDLMNIPLIEHAVVVGDAKPYLAALVTLSADGLAAFAKKQGLEGDIRNHPKVLEAIQEGVDQLNTRHARVENIRKFAVLTGALSVEGGELTPTMKVKRKVVIERHREIVESLYAK